MQMKYNLLLLLLLLNASLAWSEKAPQATLKMPDSECTTCYLALAALTEHKITYQVVAQEKSEKVVKYNLNYHYPKAAEMPIIASGKLYNKLSQSIRAEFVLFIGKQEVFRCLMVEIPENIEQILSFYTKKDKEKSANKFQTIPLPETLELSDKSMFLYATNTHFLLADFSFNKAHLFDQSYNFLKTYDFGKMFTNAELIERATSKEALDTVGSMLAHFPAPTFSIPELRGGQLVVLVNFYAPNLSTIKINDDGEDEMSVDMYTAMVSIDILSNQMTYSFIDTKGFYTKENYGIMPILSPQINNENYLLTIRPLDKSETSPFFLANFILKDSTLVFKDFVDFKLPNPLLPIERNIQRISGKYIIFRSSSLALYDIEKKKKIDLAIYADPIASKKDKELFFIMAIKDLGDGIVDAVINQNNQIYWVSVDTKSGKTLAKKLMDFGKEKPIISDIIFDQKNQLLALSVSQKTTIKVFPRAYLNQK